MFGVEDIVCCRRDYEEEYLPSGLFCSRIDAGMSYSVINGGKSARESALEEEQIRYLCHEFADESSMYLPTNPITPELWFPCEWNDGTSLQAQFLVLKDWATALHAHHVKDVVHGNLTPESVGVVHGRGTLRNPSLTRLLGHKVSWTRDPSNDDDVYGARWAATELFHVDRGNPDPTKMGDVYSFACLMLQMLTGEVPYCGTKRPEQVVYLKYLGREPIDTKTPKIADRYVAFMRWCWSPEPTKRPTMETVVAFMQGEQRGLCRAAEA